LEGTLNQNVLIGGTLPGEKEVPWWKLMGNLSCPIPWVKEPRIIGLPVKVLGKCASVKFPRASC